MSTTNLIVGKAEEEINDGKVYLRDEKLPTASYFASSLRHKFTSLFINHQFEYSKKNGLPSLLERMANNPLTRHECAFVCCLHKQFITCALKSVR